MPRGNYTIQGSCEECGKIFTPPTLMSKYCCPACSKRGIQEKANHKRERGDTSSIGQANTIQQGVSDS